MKNTDREQSPDQNAMKRKLRADLIRIASSIISNDDLTDISELYEEARTLYEKLAVLNFIEQKLKDVEVDVNKSEVASKFESIASAVLNENKLVPETNPHEEDIIIPGMDTIKHMVSEMPGGEEPGSWSEKTILNPTRIRSLLWHLTSGGASPRNP